MEERFYSRQEVCELLKISLSTLHRWIKQGTLPPPIHVGRRVYFLGSDLAKFLESLKAKGGSHERA